MTDISDLPFAYGAPPARGQLRTACEDFQVDEELGFAASGAGEHVLVQVRKRDANTEWVAKRLAALAGVKPMAVSFAGLKDRHALTSQWFSVQLPGRDEPAWTSLNDQYIEILHAARHHRKLRRGALRGNRFRLLVRDVAGARDAIDARLQAIAQGGVPAYFGAQRFGRDGDNVARALAMFGGRRVSRAQRSILLSAARSWLFNRVLAERVRRGNWNQLLVGDIAMLDGTHSVFAVTALDETLQRRCAQMDLHPTGPLWGRGEPATAGLVLEWEQQAVADQGPLREGLVAAGLDQQRRTLRQAVRELRWQWQDAQTLVVSFYLDAGNYATSVMREVLGDEQASRALE